MCKDVDLPEGPIILKLIIFFQVFWMACKCSRCGGGWTVSLSSSGGIFELCCMKKDNYGVYLPSPWSPVGLPSDRVTMSGV